MSPRPQLRKRLRDGLARTRARMRGGMSRALAGRTRVDADLLEAIEEALYAGDVGVAASERIMEGLRERVRRDRLRRVEDVLDAVFAEVVEILGPRPAAILPEGSARPRVVLVVGVNGSGKTTTVGKLAARYGGAGKQVVVAAADTFRAAAIEQLAVWSERAGAHLVRQDIGADAAAVAFDALAAARARDADVLLVDTAGRLHTRTPLMEELRKLRRVLRRQDETIPHETLLVLDGVTGQNGLVQAREFHDALGLSGIVLTKLDGTAKGGVVLAIAQELGIPVRMVGVGEGADDLQDFEPETFAEALLAVDPGDPGDAS